MTGYDVDGALADGGPAVDILSDYVAACRALGHTVVDPAQLHDAYSAENGMDLVALAADCEAVTGAQAIVEEAARVQASAQAVLAEAWQGAGSAAAAQLIDQHALSSEQAVTALRSVANTLNELRDTLWQLVDGKVSGVQGIEGRAEREHWWPAACAVSTGAGAQDTASEIIDRQVNPFVTQAIGSDWADLMDSTSRSVRNAYDNAAAGISAATPPFGVPAGTPVSDAVPPTGAVPMSSALPSGGAGLSSMGTGLSGLGQQIADLIGGLLTAGSDSLDDGAVDPAGDELAAGGAADEDDAGDDTENDDEGGDRDEDGDADEADDDTGVKEPPSGAISPGTEVIEGEPEPSEALPAPESAVDAPPAGPAMEPPAPEPVRSPCEIAADELPQAGG